MATATRTPRPRARTRKTSAVPSVLDNMPVSQTPAARKARGEKVEDVPAPKVVTKPLPDKAPRQTRKAAVKAVEAPAKAAAKKPRAKKVEEVPAEEIFSMERCTATTTEGRKKLQCMDVSLDKHRHSAWVNDSTMKEWDN